MIKLEIKTIYRNLIVPMHIWHKNKNDFEKVDALIDTGAHTSAIDIYVLKNLKYDVTNMKKSYVHTASQNNMQVAQINIDRIILDKEELQNVLFNTFEFPNTLIRLLSA